VADGATGYARGRLRDKIPGLEEAPRGVTSDTRRWLLREQLHKVTELGEGIVRLKAKGADLCLPFAQALVEASWAASHTKQTSLSATFRRIKGRRGGKRACPAVGHRTRSG
jgi:hypothetical protein